MKPLQFYRPSLLFICSASFVSSACADVFYSGQQDIPIPIDLTGLYLNVLTGSQSNSGWHINATFGGIDVYNSNVFQPVRTGNNGSDTIRNLAQHDLVSSSTSSYATGYGVSYDYLGSTFTAGTEGYLGFSVENGPETQYGWLRAIFTGIGSPVIKDWAYNTGGGSIGVGNVHQFGSTFTLDSTAQSFTLISAIGGLNNVVKVGGNTATLGGLHSYTGNTTINHGTLALADGASISNTSTISVSSGADFDVAAMTGGWSLGSTQTLTGSGRIVGNINVSGTHAPGNGIGFQTFQDNLSYDDSSIFEWQMNYGGSTRGTHYDAVDLGGSLGGSDSVFRIILSGSGSFTDAFWTTSHSWANIFTELDGSIAVSDWSTAFSSFQFYNTDGVITGPDLSTQGAFSLTGNTLTWTAVPETNTSCLTILLLACACRRRRN